MKGCTLWCACAHSYKSDWMHTCMNAGRMRLLKGRVSYPTFLPYAIAYINLTAESRLKRGKANTVVNGLDALPELGPEERDGGLEEGLSDSIPELTYEDKVKRLDDWLDYTHRADILQTFSSSSLMHMIICKQRKIHQAHPLLIWSNERQFTPSGPFPG